MKRNALVIVLAGAAIAVAAWRLAPAVGLGEHSQVPAPTGAAVVSNAPAPAKTRVPAASAGYVVHFDDKGQIVEGVSPQAQAEFNAELNAAINTSSEGLVEKAIPAAGGGTMVDLQGRFQSAATATRDKDGNLVVPCLTNEADVRAFTSAIAADNAAKKK